MLILIKQKIKYLKILLAKFFKKRIKYKLIIKETF